VESTPPRYLTQNAQTSHLLGVLDNRMATDPTQPLWLGPFAHNFGQHPETFDPKLPNLLCHLFLDCLEQHLFLEQQTRHQGWVAFLNAMFENAFFKRNFFNSKETSKSIEGKLRASQMLTFSSLYCCSRGIFEEDILGREESVIKQIKSLP